MTRRTSWAGLTGPLRAWPAFVIVGAQRGGTSSLHEWLSAHPAVLPAAEREVHYFDNHYDRGPRWYRAQFPLRRPGRMTGESTPFMLFHPLAPERARRDLPATTRFIALLRDPAQRAISHYWLARASGYEGEDLERALALEPARTRGEMELLRAGGNSVNLHRYSYVARGEYAPQLRRWFDTVSRERVLVLESEQLFAQHSQRAVTEFLGLTPHPAPFPQTNRAPRSHHGVPDDLVARLRAHFAPHNEELFSLLGRRLWDGAPTQEAPLGPSPNAA